MCTKQAADLLALSRRLSWQYFAKRNSISSLSAIYFCHCIIIAPSWKTVPKNCARSPIHLLRKLLHCLLRYVRQTCDRKNVTTRLTAQLCLSVMRKRKALNEFLCFSHFSFRYSHRIYYLLFTKMKSADPDTAIFLMSGVCTNEMLFVLYCLWSSSSSQKKGLSCIKIAEFLRHISRTTTIAPRQWKWKLWIQKEASLINDEGCTYCDVDASIRGWRALSTCDWWWTCSSAAIIDCGDFASEKQERQVMNRNFIIASRLARSLCPTTNNRITNSHLTSSEKLCALASQQNTHIFCSSIVQIIVVVGASTRPSSSSSQHHNRV